MPFRHAVILPSVVLVVTVTAGVLGMESGECPCKFHGELLPPSVYKEFPIATPEDCYWKDGAVCDKWPGFYMDEPATPLYGTSCAAWDQMPGTPWNSYCPSDADWSQPDYNWCQQPWCYVDADCPDALPSTVFVGSDVAFYSYKSCGHNADCYTGIAWNEQYEWPLGCPYDPTGTQSYKVHKSGDCACSFQGQAIASNIYMDFPLAYPEGCQGMDCYKWPGMYKDIAAVKYYGSTCAAWDQIPGTPWHSYCPAGSDWCHYDYNWCQQPWCYVSQQCQTGVTSTVYSGSDVAFYSYDTCLNSPDCYTDIAWVKKPESPPMACPFDAMDNMWYTAKMCPEWSEREPCACKFQGMQLPMSVYHSYPMGSPVRCYADAGTVCEKYPGMYKHLDATPLYGTSCAAWDQMPATPWKSFCPPDADWSDPDYNWCQQPWCFVDESCPDAIPSDTFKGSDIAFYSYVSCGHHADCYTDIAWKEDFVWPTGCPYDPTGDETYKVHKSGDCACMFHGDSISSDVYEEFPMRDPPGCWMPSQDDGMHDDNDGMDSDMPCKSWPGMYADLVSVTFYGTTCAAWDQMPGTPWHSYCPAGSDWCHRDFNWCQQPWCYVSPNCHSGVASTVYKGSDILFYSYDTCLSTPDCYTNVAWAEQPESPEMCPFDRTDNMWHTAKMCPEWTMKKEKKCLKLSEEKILMMAEKGFEVAKCTM